MWDTSGRKMKLHFDNGIHNISNEIYHSADAVSRSNLTRMKNTPRNYWFDYISGLKEKERPTEPMVFGELFHTLSLEPHLFSERFVLAPSCKRTTKEGKRLYKEFLTTLSNRRPIAEAQYVLALDMSAQVNADPIASELLAGCHIEQSIFFTHEPTGLQCKVRPDAWHGAMAFDLKSSKDASERGFQQAALKHDYYLQAAMNFRAFESIGIELDEFIFISVEKEEPYLIAIDRVCKEDAIGSALEYGLRVFDERMGRLNQCITKGKWPGYGIRELKVPKWANYEQLVEIE